MEQKYGSLTRATLRAMRQRRANSKAGNPAPPLFMTLKGGLEQMTKKLAEFPEKSRVYLERRVGAITPAPGGPGGRADSCSRRYQIHCEDGVTYDADAVILAMPTGESGRLLSALDPALSDLLGAIPYSSSMTVSMAFGAEARAQLPPGFGFLAPREEKRRMLACTFVHTKFHYRAPERKALLRCFLGGAYDPEVLNLTDEEAVALVRKELKEILNFSAEPLFYRVHRWPSSMAQYIVGHSARLEQIRARLGEHPGLFLAGNGYSGIGISDCVRTGRAAAQAAVGLP
jgi:oxygen-dependent protoporphyrinogen oxidase